MGLAVVLLAAGQGTRMNSKRPKVLHEVGGKPMVQHIFETVLAVTDLPPVLVVGVGEDGVQQLLGEGAVYVVQAERLGTGHATLMAEAVLSGRANQVLVTYGDMPLLRPETLRQLAQSQATQNAALSLLTVQGAVSSTFGRVVRDQSGRIIEILEVAQARRRPNPEQWLAISELNVGVYCFAADWLWANLPDLPLRQARSGREYYLTDMVEKAVQQGQPVATQPLADPDEGLGAGTRQELAVVEAAFRQRLNKKWLAAGVTLRDPQTTYIDPDVTIGQDTIIWPNTHLQGQTIIGEGCQIGPNSIIRQATIGNGCRVEQAVIENITLPDNIFVAPFSYLHD